jgi:tRNA-dihydrouridine synthase A
MIPFIEHHLENGVRLNTITKHMLGLFHGCNGGRAFRRYISDNVRKESGIDVFLAAVEKVGYARHSSPCHSDRVDSRRFRV